MRNQPSASIENLLSKVEDCTVDDLLADEDIIQEMRNMNEKLLKYFRRDKLKTLIDYITKVPEEDTHDRGHKFPFVVGELFALDLTKINDKFFNEEEDEVEEEEVEAEGSQDLEDEEKKSEGEGEGES